MAKYSMYGMAGIGVAAAIGFVFVLSSLGNSIPQTPTQELGVNTNINTTGQALPTPFILAATQELKKFSSIDELKVFLLDLEQRRGVLGGSFFGEGAIGRDFEFAVTPQASPSPAAPAAEDDFNADITDGDLKSYSTTNVQVEGVDEPDFLKNDGKYVYVLSGDRLTIVDAYPPENATIAVKIALDIQQGQYLQNMFLNNDTLVIFYQEYGQDFVIQEYDFAPQPVYSPRTHALIMDVSDREKPEIVKDYEITGNYNNARMIGSSVYFITTSNLYDYGHPVIPKIAESSRTVVFPEIYYFDNPELEYPFNTVSSIDISALDSDSALESKTFMMNPAATLYVSEDNIYIAYEKNLPYQYYYDLNTEDRFFDAVVPELPAAVQQQIKDINSDDSLSPSEKWDRISELLQDTYNNMSESEKEQLF